MPCKLGLGGFDCSRDHWSRYLDNVGDGAKGFRARCPLCGGARTLTYWAEDERVAFRCFHDGCDKVALRLKLSEVIKTGCVTPPRGAAERAKRNAELTALALAPLQPVALRLLLLEMAGWETRAALDELKVSPGHRSRVISRARLGVTPQVGSPPGRARLGAAGALMQFTLAPVWA